MNNLGPVALPGPEGIAALVCDLDGVVYRGQAAVPHAVKALRRVAVPIVYATNNAGRPPHVVADHLRELGLAVDDSDVLTSAQAGAAAIAARMPGATVLAVGGEGVEAALAEAGLSPTRDGRASCDAVMQGYGPQVSMADLADAAIAVQQGAWWVATNTDLTIPIDRGIAPGNGTLVRAVAQAAGRIGPGLRQSPPDLYRCGRTSQRPGRSHPRASAMARHRHRGANAAGSPSVLVLTGRLGESAQRAPRHQQPSTIIDDLRDLDGLVITSR